MTLPTPVLTTMINQLSTLVMGDDDEHPPHVKDKEKEKKKVVLKGSLASVQEARLMTDGKLVTNVSQVLDVISNSFSNCMTNSTMCKESAPKSSTICLSSVTSDISLLRCSAIIFSTDIFITPLLYSSTQLHFYTQ